MTGDLILRIVAKLLMPFMLLFALYVQFHGDFGPGGGFQAGVIVASALVLYAIMVTGSIWEKVVFGKYLFAPAFFWEDLVSMGVLALHTAYLVALAQGLLEPRGLMLLALAAYAAYVINAVQFIVKLRAARRDAAPALAVTSSPKAVA